MVLMLFFNIHYFSRYVYAAGQHPVRRTIGYPFQDFSLFGSQRTIQYDTAGDLIRFQIGSFFKLF
jgi:hypothetical protein